MKHPSNKKIIFIFSIVVFIILFNGVESKFHNQIYMKKNINPVYRPPRALIIGEISDLDSSGFFTTFTAINIIIIQLIP